MKSHTKDRAMEEIEAAIKYKTDEYNELLKKYGTGVRPSWVSAELAHIGMDIQSYRLALEEQEVDF